MTDAGIRILEIDSRVAVAGDEFQLVAELEAPGRHTGSDLVRPTAKSRRPGAACRVAGTGKWEFPAPLVETVERLGFESLPITPAHAEYAGSLPPHHNDPFDRMLVAQAMLEGLALGTQDPLLGRYAVPTLGLA